jgi:uncharacterized protein YyaL (SSP411 family)
MASLETYQLAGDRFFADVAEDTLEYVRREMTNADGGFFSAEDADSVPPEDEQEPHPLKKEGAFYLWTDAELDQWLGEDAQIFKTRFGIRPDGNAPEDPQGEFTGKNLLYVAGSIEEIAEKTGKSKDEVEAALHRARMVLFKARLARPRPYLDDKVLTGWNGLMLAAFARAARMLPSADARARYLESAVRNAQFLEKVMWDPSRQILRRRYREGDAAIDGYAEDYAYLIHGLLELFQANGDAHWLEWALTLQARQDAQFWDEEHGGWFNTTGEDPSVILRLKEDYDGAEPAPSSVSVFNLLFLSHLTGEGRFVEQIEKTLKMFGPNLAKIARAVPMLMAALSTYHAGIRQIVIVGDRSSEDAAALHAELAGIYQPFSVTVGVQPGAQQTDLARLLPFIASMGTRDGKATAYVCQHFTCGAPVTEPAELRAIIAPE